MARKYKQGKWFPRNPQKYAADASSIVYRSSWELRFFRWADQNQSVVWWKSESTVVPYLCETDNKMHRYFVDITMQIRSITGETRTYMVEIKPYAQTLPPKQPKRATPRFLAETETFVKNQCKWRAAREFAKRHNAEFVIITEKELGIDK